MTHADIDTQQRAVSIPESGVLATAMHYLACGSGRSVVFLHGLGASKELWRPTLRALAPHYRAVALEWPGHGSSPPPPDYDLEQMTVLALESCSALSFTSFTLVGHSLGGNIAVRMALSAPARVHQLVLVDAALDARDFALWRRSDPPPYSDRAHRALRGITRPLAWLGQHMPAEGGALQPFARRVHAWQPVTAAAMRGYMAAIWAHPLGPRLEGIQQPVLIVHGTRDPLVLPRQARRAAARIPNARLCWLRGAFHTPMDEQPEAFIAALRGFLAEASPESPPVPT